MVINKSPLKGFVVVIPGKSDKVFETSQDALQYLSEQKNVPAKLYHPEGYLIITRNDEKLIKN